MKKYAHKVVNNIKHAFKKKPLLIKTIFILVTIIALNLSLLFVVRTKTVENALKRLLVAVDVYTNAVEKVEMNSDGWKDNKPGSWHIEKSAHWTGVDTAEVDITLDTKEKLDISNTHVIRDLILVIDSSLSMENDSKLDVVKEQAKKLVDAYLFDEKNHMALIEFNDEAESLQYFTKDKETLKSSIDEINPVGNTNYNDALKKVGDTLAKYDIDTDMERPYKSVLVLFLTDGVPCIDTPNEVATYAKLKSTYSYIHIKGIQYEMGEKITPYLERITDSQNIATKETLGQIFFGATIVTERYKSFVITDYIKDKYFYIKSKDDIKVGKGTIELLEENGGQKVVWDLGDDLASGTGYRTTESHDLYMKINLTLKEEYAKDNDRDYYPTNSKLSVSSQLPNENVINKEDDKTPVLKRIYNVIYDPNLPPSCNTLKKEETETHYALGNVTKKQDQLICQDYLFKGWEIVEDDVTQKSEDIFVMPTHDVNIKGVWSKLSIVKKFEGTIVKKIDLYDQVKYDAEVGNIGSTYTGAVTDTFDKTKENEKIYYYTSPEKNNIVFGGFCWQMIRTTTTGGVKIIYNGPYTEENKCNNKGTQQQLENKSYFNEQNMSLAYVGYMYSDVYETKEVSKSNILDSTYFGNSVEWDGSQYTLKDSKAGIDDNHHYSCDSNNNENDTCKKVRYYTYETTSTSPTYEYIVLENGDTIEKALVKMIGYEEGYTKDVINENLNKNDSIIKKAIDEWYAQNISNDYGAYIEDVVYCNNRKITDIGSFNPNGGSLKTNPTIKTSSSDKVIDFTCPLVSDRFSISNEHAKLTYPVGLLTSSEALAMDKTFLTTGEIYFINNPTGIAFGRVMNSFISKDGQINGSNQQHEYGVRPVISLKTGVKYKNGTGTIFDPYIIDTTQ